MGRSTDRLVPAPDMQSVRGLWRYKSKTLEGPAATLADGGPGAGNTWTRDLSTPHRCYTNEGADVAQSTRGFPRSDSETRTSAVKITPVSSVSATVPSTLTAA
jgi:hypothetical protein